MLKASIDIGTNSVLLLVAELTGNTITPIIEKQEVPRLGRGVDGSGELHPESCERVLSVLTSYRDFLSEHYPKVVENVIVTATSAVRDASNREEFINSILNQTGWSVRLLSGQEEALTTYHGAISVLQEQPENIVVLDIGGGSTEIAIGESDELKSYLSIDMGSVRFSERFLKSNPPEPGEISLARRNIQELMDNSPVNRNMKGVVVGVAGTVTSIASIEMGLQDYEPDLLNGYKLKRRTIDHFITTFSRISSEEIESNYKPFLTGRGDVILGGLLILDEFLKWIDTDSITVSTGGIRHGILMNG